MKSVLLFFALTLTVLSAASAASASLNQVWWTKYNGKKDQVGCRNMCCSGRDSKCYSSGPRMGGRTSSNGKCFCDEGCLDMKDCCQDYSLVCQAVDCAVGEWSEYGPCNRACSLGSKTRTREIVQEPENGGQECPTLKETTICFGTRCKSQRHTGRRGRVDRETARIMPAHFGRFRNYRQYNAHLDIRKNLFYKYYAQSTADRRGYCAMYKITSARQSCFSVPWANVLTTGKEICVECQNKAMDGGVGNRCVGHGTAEKETFWTAVNTRGCHGWWQRVSELSECSCNSNHGRDFIFV